MWDKSEGADLHAETGDLPLHSPLGLRLLLQLLHQAVPVLFHLTQATRHVQLLTGLLREQLLDETREGGVNYHNHSPKSLYYEPGHCYSKH